MIADFSFDASHAELAGHIKREPFQLLNPVDSSIRGFILYIAVHFAVTIPESPRSRGTSEIDEARRTGHEKGPLRYDQMKRKTCNIEFVLTKSNTYPLLTGCGRVRWEPTA
jgi:hypothetical protein